MGDTGDNVWVGGTKVEAGGIEIGPGCAGCV